MPEGDGVLMEQGMREKPYYLKYEDRYRKAYTAGAEHWGPFSDDEELVEVLAKWVAEHNLIGKKVIEFACGEGACGVILSRLGCVYHGVDIAPSAIEKARHGLQAFASASVEVLDMVHERISGCFDAALDVMGFHMLVTDEDRQKYLQNVMASLNGGSPMLFFRESYRADWIEKSVGSYEEWKAITVSDYDKPEQRFVEHGNTRVEVWVPLIPARAKNKEGYMTELSDAGFVIDKFVEMDANNKIAYAASMFVHKP
jgi:hypothetical protein